MAVRRLDSAMLRSKSRLVLHRHGHRRKILCMLSDCDSESSDPLELYLFDENLQAVKYDPGDVRPTYRFVSFQRGSE